jgi:hypothetical protein
MKTWHQVEVEPVTIEAGDDKWLYRPEDMLTVEWGPEQQMQAQEDYNRAVAGYQQDALARQLANDEPKCGNCRYWFSLVRGLEQPIGNCDLIAQAGEAVQVRTTDLSVCSAWTPKSA